MLYSSYHNHTNYDDGKNTIAEMIAAAIEQDFLALGFSCHSPLPFTTRWTKYSLEECQQIFNAYCQEINDFRENEPVLELYIGLELDYLGAAYDLRSIYPNIERLDYIIGSIHGIREPGDFLALNDKDGHLGLYSLVRHMGGVKKLICVYYERIIEMLATGHIDIVGHLDIIKKHLAKICDFDFEATDWYQDYLHQCLQEIAKHNSMLELNTSLAARNNSKEPYPSPWILQLAKDLNIDIVINSDAHSVQELSINYLESARMLKSIGIKSTKMLLAGSWQNIAIDS